MLKLLQRPLRYLIFLSYFFRGILLGDFTCSKSVVLGISSSYKLGTLWMILGSLAAVSFSVSTVFRFSMCFKTCIFDEDRFLHHSLSLIQVSAKPKQKHASTAVVHAIIMKVPISSFASGKIRSREWVTLTIKATKSM